MKWWLACRWLLLVSVTVELVSFVNGYKLQSSKSMRQLAQLSESGRLDIDGPLLKPLLVERVSGTESNRRVQEFIAAHFVSLGWHVELDNFTDTTPDGPVQFTNIIVTKDPTAEKRLVLAAHFDSLRKPDYAFIGATDSAVPCAILMDIATSLNRALDDPAAHKKGTTLQMIFFDGEEAFKKWGPKDSIYGARHLAERWSAPRMIDSDITGPTSTTTNQLAEIEVLVLLDLLGTTNPSIPNYFPATSGLFQKLFRLEARLHQLKLLETVSVKTGEALLPIFDPHSPMTFQSYAIEDDHVPFLRRGVDILHCIPFPFPDVWHNSGDNADCIDPSMVRNLAILFRIFTAEYLEVDLLFHDEL